MEPTVKVFLGTSDSKIISELDQLAQKIGVVDTFAGVIGGLACFSLIEKIRPEKAILFDRSPAQFSVFRMVKALVKISAGPDTFVSRLLSRTNFLGSQPAEKRLLEKTLLTLEGFSDFDSNWMATLSALTAARALDKGVYMVPETNGARPLFVQNPARYDLNQKAFKPYSDHLPLSLFYGEGWLKNQQSFEYIKNRLTVGTIEAIEAKIPKIKPFGPFWSSRSNLFWVSNIGFFLYWNKQPAEERLKFLRRLPEQIKILTSERLYCPSDLLDWQNLI